MSGAARSSARSMANDAIKQQLIDGELRRDAQSEIFKGQVTSFENIV